MTTPPSFDSKDISLLFNLYRAAYDTKYITLQDFKTVLNYFQYYDTEQRLWTLGTESGKWYHRVGDNWIPGFPEGHLIQAWTYDAFQTHRMHPLEHDTITRNTSQRPMEVIKVRCQNCKTLNPESAKFCNECGDALQ